MPYDDFKAKGPLKGNSPSSGGANIKNVPIIGIVKDNIDPNRSGRIRVALMDKSGTSPDSSDSWVTVSYLSSFFGTVGGTAGNGAEDYGTYKTNPSSYGMWQAPPDIGTKVVCLFINGDINYGFYIGCIPEPETLQMVPTIGASDKVIANTGEAKSFGGATRLPVTNLNVNNKSKADSNQFLETHRPVHSYTASIMNQQGILRDPVRGPIGSSASREPASRVGWGVSSPGRPIYEGGYDDSNIPDNLTTEKSQQLKVVARRGGHSIVMDDGDIIGRDQLIRIRTSLGHQIMMSDDGQTLMILHSNGQSYIELGKEGTVDIYSTNSINMRTQGDFNIHADRDINVHANENLNFRAKNITHDSEENINQKAGASYKIMSQNNFTAKAGASIAFNAGGEGSLNAGGPAYINGSKVNLNTGSPSTKAEDVEGLTLNAQTDTLYDEEKGFIASPGKLLSVTTRTPAHAPWANAGQGVDIQTSVNQKDQLPKEPSLAVNQLNKIAVATGVTPPPTATISSVPNTPAASSSMNSGTTKAVLGSVATAVAQGPTKEAADKGAAICPINNDKILAVGSFGQSSKQLVKTGVLKPGVDKLVSALVDAGKNIEQVIPKKVFAGVAEAKDIVSLGKNVAAQAKSMVNNLEKAQGELVTAGVISGKEDPIQIAGLVTSAAVAGTKNTIDTVQQFATKVSTNINNTTPSLTNTVLNAVNKAETLINTTNNANNIANNVTNKARGVLGAIGAGTAAAGKAASLNGLGGLSNSLNAMAGKLDVKLSNLVESLRGVTGEAFDAIKNSFGELEANVPQNLSKFAKDLATTTAAAASKVPDKPLGSNNSLSTLADKSNIISGTVNNTVNGIIGSVNNLSNVATQTLPSFNNLINTVATAGSTNNSTTTNSSNVTPQTTTSGLLSNNTQPPNTTLANNVSNAFNMINGAVGASAAMASGGLNALSNAAKTVQKGAGASVSSLMASGVKNLPGGENAISTVTNLAPGAKNLMPGASELTNAVSSLQNDVVKGLNTANNALSKVGNLVGQAGGQLSSIAGSIENATKKIGGLTSLISSKLPIGEASKLLSAISSLGGDSSSMGIKLPSIGFNTLDRSSITNQIKNILGDIGIPTPNLVGEILEETISSLEAKSIELRTQYLKVESEYKAILAKVEATKKNYIETSNNSSPGDPRIEETRKAYYAASEELDKAATKLLDAFNTTAN